MNKTLTPLFYRKLELSNKSELFISNIKKYLSVSKIETWTEKKTIKLFDINFESEYIAYRFQILREWIIKNQSYNVLFVNELEKNINSLMLGSCLTTQEWNFINDYKSVVFAKNRNIKNLIVDFYLYPKENIWYTYNILVAYKIDNKLEIIAKNIQIYLSNIRIFFANQGKIYHTINNDDIIITKLKNNSLEIQTTTNKILIIADQITTIYVSFERLAKLIKKQF